MTQPLTAEWLRQLEATTSAIETDPSVSLVIQQTVSSEPPLQWHVVITGGSATTVVGPTVDPDISLRTDHQTAVDIATGKVSAQRAFLEGALQISGRIDSLIQARNDLESIGDSLWKVRKTAEVSNPPES